MAAHFSPLHQVPGYRLKLRGAEKMPSL